MIKYKPTINRPIQFEVEDPSIIRGYMKQYTPVTEELSEAEESPAEAPESTAVFKSPFTSRSLTSAIEKYLNIPYLYGGNSSTGMDCSAFTHNVAKELGYNISRGSINQWDETDRIDMNNLQVGDLVFLQGTQKQRKAGLPSHVAIVTDVSDLKNGKIKVAEAHGKQGTPSETNRVWNLNTGYYKDHWLGAGRMRKGIAQAKTGMRLPRLLVKRTSLPNIRDI